MKKEKLLDFKNMIAEISQIEGLVNKVEEIPQKVEN